MPISSSLRSAGPFAGTGSNTGPFSFAFKVFAASDVRVEVDGAALVSGYTVGLNADQDNNPGGSVLLASALASGAELYVRSAIPYTQPLDIQNQDGFEPRVITEAFDRQTALVQQAKAQIDGVDDAIYAALAAEDGAELIGHGGNTLAELLDALTVGDATLRLDLANGASGKGAELVEYNGGTVEDALDALGAADTTLRDDLADTAPGGGAELVEYDGATVEDFLDALVDTGGADEIGFLQAGTDARDDETVQDQIRHSVRVDSFRLAIDADDTNALVRAVDALNTIAGGGDVLFSRRSYDIGNVTFTAKNGVRLKGAGKSDAGTIIRPTSATGDTITFYNCQYSGVEDLYFRPAIRKTSGYCVVLSGGCYFCHVDAHGDYVYGGVNIAGATESRVSWTALHILGPLNVNMRGTLTYNNYRVILRDVLVNNPYPASTSGHVTRTDGMGLALGKTFVANNAIWQCVQAGTTGTGAPSGWPSGTTPQSVFSTDVTDGTAKVRWVCHAGLVHVVQDSYTYSVVLQAVGCINGATGFMMQDTDNTGSSYPMWAFVVDLELDHAYSDCLQLLAGEGFYDGGNSWVGSSISGNGIVIGASFRGDAAISDAMRCYGNYGHGLLRYAGPTDVVIRGEYTDNSVAGSGLFNGVNIAANSVDTRVIGVRAGDGIGVAGNNQAYGVLAGANCDKLVVEGCYLYGNATGALAIGSGCTSTRVERNDGYNPVGASSVTVGASPFTHTAGYTPEVVFIRGGSVSDVKVNGVSVFNATGVSVPLRPGQTCTVTYSSAPTMTKALQ